jgi:hypothetical protein
MNTAVKPNTLERQKACVERLKRENFKYGLTVGAAFVRGIRKVGYRHTGTALDELLDNALEAGASEAHVVFGYEGRASDKKPTQIAVIDNAVGIIPEMLRVAVLWGGTDRENSRTGLGRFGYGLPSSCMSQGKRFEVYSKTLGGSWNMAAIDLDEIERGDLTSKDGDIVVPPAKAATLPAFVQEYIAKTMPGGKLERGTVVVIDKLDNLTWVTANALQDNLLKHFGVTYHQLRADFDIHVNGVRCEPIDPLFLTPGFRWYDLDAYRAKAFDPMPIEVKDRDTKEVLGRIRIRFSYMPLGFASIDKNKEAIGKNQNLRFWVLKEYNGFIISRMGRVVDVIRSSPLTTFVNYDRYIKIEIDFDATLDEEFNVPTNKQRVDISERIWHILEEAGILKALEQLRAKRKEDKSAFAVEKDTQQGEPRPSETAMEQAAKLSPRLSPETEARRQREGQRGLQQHAEKRSAETGKPVEETRKEIEGELSGRSYSLAKESVPGGNFFRVEQIGGSKVLFLNTATRFFKEVYAGPESTPTHRWALEVLLFAIGDRILDAQDELRATYDHEIPEWSRKLEFALAKLSLQAVTVTAEDADQSDASKEVELTAAE